MELCTSIQSFGLKTLRALPPVSFCIQFIQTFYGEENILQSSCSRLHLELSHSSRKVLGYWKGISGGHRPVAEPSQIKRRITRRQRKEGGKTESSCSRMRGWLIYLTSKQLYISANQKEILIAKSSQCIQPNPCHGDSSSGIPLGLGGHLGLGDCMPRTRPRSSFLPHQNIHLYVLSPAAVENFDMAEQEQLTNMHSTISQKEYAATVGKDWLRKSSDDFGGKVHLLTC